MNTHIHRVKELLSKKVVKLKCGRYYKIIEVVSEDYLGNKHTYELSLHSKNKDCLKLINIK